MRVAKIRQGICIGWCIATARFKIAIAVLLAIRSKVRTIEVEVGNLISNSRGGQNYGTMLIEFLLAALLPPGTFGFGKTVTIGGLFEEGSHLQNVFKSSIASLNSERHGNEDLPNQFIQLQQVDGVNNDSYDVARAVCDLADNGVAAIFGPQDRITSRTVQSMCDRMEIPHIAARWDSQQIRGNGLINMYPHSQALSMVYLQLAQDYKWKGFTILYESMENLVRMNQLLKRSSLRGSTVTVRQLPEGSDYRKILSDVRSSGDTNIVLDCSKEILSEVLKQAQQVALMSPKYNYIIGSLDLQTIDLEPYKYGGTNFLAFRLIDPEDPVVMEAFMKYGLDWELTEPSQLTVEAALVYDSVQLFGRALKNLDDATMADVGTSLCSNLDSWDHGSSFMNIMRLTEFRGLTGPIKFDPSGYRSDFKLDVISLNVDGVQKIGEWKTSSGLEYIPKSVPNDRQIELSLRNKTFIVLISITPPYGMLKESAEAEVGNERYEGFGIDIIGELSKMLGFNYTFQEHDSNYGSKNTTTGKWGGMMLDIMEGRADLAITDLTVTADRQEVVDFTMPFMNLGISILFTKPVPAGPNLFSFLMPYSTGVWKYFIGAYTLTALLLFVVGRLCPDEWINPYPCIEEPKELENQFSLKNSFWFLMGQIMQQGSELAPIGLSTRMIGSCWAFFTLIIVQSYIAQLAAVLVLVSDEILIKNVQDLAKNPHGIKYGAKRIGSTNDFFKYSTDPLYSEMYKYMIANKDEVLMEDNDAGVAKVLKGRYAYFMESSTIAYQAERKCSLTQLGGLLDAKSYGIAMKKHSPYRTLLNTAMLTLQESGVLEELRIKWWEQKRGGGSCKEKKVTSTATALGTQNVGGVFLVLGVGLAISILLAIAEFVWEIAWESNRTNASFTNELKEELKFLVKLSHETKPVRRRKSSSASNLSRDGDSVGGYTPPRGVLPTVITTTPGEQ